MTLLITVFAAIVSTVAWYRYPNSIMRPGMLSLMYWGASLMWLVDAVAEYINIGAVYFVPSEVSMINDGFLGLSVVTLGLIIWLAVVIVKDRDGRVKSALSNK